MAILGKIRQKSFFLILVIGLALFAFIVSGIFGNAGQGGSEPIGVINGEDVPIENFRNLVNNVERTYNSTTMQAIELAWDQYLSSTLLKEELDKLGIDAGRDQIEQAISDTKTITEDSRFIDEGGFFDFQLFSNFVVKMKKENPQAYDQWKRQEQSIIASARQEIFLDLIKAGVVVTEAEAKQQYHLENDNINISYVQIPYSVIPNKEVKVTDKEILSYIKKNSKKYKATPSRGIDYIVFPEKASKKDEDAIRGNLASLLERQVEYNDVSKLTDTIEGFRDTKNIVKFVERYSEEGFDSIYVPKGALPRGFGDLLYNLKKGEVFGPYKDGESYKISRLLDRKNKGSIRASHILISYKEATGAGEGITRTKEEAKKYANELYAEVRKDKNKLELLANKYSDDSSSKSSAGDLGYFQEGAVPESFYQYVDKKKKGSIGVVETDFGFHVVKIIDKQDLVLLASVSNSIVPSEKTSNAIFKKATQFEREASKNKSEFKKIAEASKYKLKSIAALGELDGGLPNLPQQRQIVQWAFNEETKVGDIKRFNLTMGGFVIIQLKKKRNSELADIEDVRKEVSEILVDDKKAAQIISKNKGISSLKELAAKNSVEIVKASAINQKNFFLVGSGEEPYVIGAAFSLGINKISSLIKGNKGVYMVRVESKKIADDLPSYGDYANSLTAKAHSEVAGQIIDALKSQAEIEDNRALYY